MRSKERRVEKLEDELPPENGSEGRGWTWLDVPPKLVEALERTYELERECGLWEGNPREAALEDVEMEVRQRPDEFLLPESDHYTLDEEEKRHWERILREARREADESPGEGPETEENHA